MFASNQGCTDKWTDLLKLKPPCGERPTGMSTTNIVTLRRSENLQKPAPVLLNCSATCCGGAAFSTNHNVLSRSLSQLRLLVSFSACPSLGMAPTEAREISSQIRGVSLTHPLANRRPDFAVDALDKIHTFAALCRSFCLGSTACGTNFNTTDTHSPGPRPQKTPYTSTEDWQVFILSVTSAFMRLGALLLVLVFITCPNSPKDISSYIANSVEPT